MARLKIKDAPLLPVIRGDEKIPTGGKGDFTLTPNMLAEHFKSNSGFATDAGLVVVDNKLKSHTDNKNNPHQTTKEQVGLGSVDNTSDINKPVSNATSIVLDTKADKIYVDQLIINANNGITNYQTQAQLLAFVPTTENYTAKALDTKKVWLWDGVQWNDTGLSELDLAKDEISRVENNLKIKMYQSNSENLFEFSDADGNLTARIDKDGLLHLVGLDSPVQVEIKQTFERNEASDIYQFSDAEDNIVLKIDKDGLLYVTGFDKPLQLEIKQTFESSSSSDIYQFLDAEGNLIARIDKDGLLHIVGLDKDLVSELDSIRSEISNQSESTKDTSVALNRDYKDTFYQPMQTVLNMLQSAQSGAKAPPPLHLCNHNFTITKDWINQIEMYGDADSQIVRVKTPYHEDGGVVHPNVIEFYNGFRGYRYIACITPYHLTNEAEENPVIYGSHDLTSFEMLDGFTQPLDERPQPAFSTGHNSDNVLTYDPRTGELICVWRQTLRNPNNDGVRTDNLWMRKTKDGYNWSDKEEILLNRQVPNSGIAGSPAIIYDAKSGYWYMYLTKLGGNMPDELKLFKNKNLSKNGWEFVSTIVTPFNPWHQEVKIIGNKVCLLVYCFGVHTMYFGISDNFTDFQWTENLYKDTALGTYKASFIPTFNESNQLALNIIYTTHANNPIVDEKWRLYVHQTNFINANVELI